MAQARPRKPPPHHKFQRLSPELTRFIEDMGLYFENQGTPRIGGRILGLLMIAHEPLSAEDISKILRVSRASVSTNMRLLTSSGMIEKAPVLHDRTTYYAFSEAALEQRLAVGVKAAVVFRKVAEEGLAALSKDDSARHRLQASIEWADVLARAMQAAIEEWRSRNRGQPARRNTA